MKHSFLSIFFALFVGLPAVLGQDITATVTHQSAPNVNDGAIDLSVNGGFPPYEYSWKGPGGFTATTQDISGLAPGQYCVTVTDALCGTAALCRIVRRCDPILAAATGVRCPYNSNGFFTLWLSGTGTFTLQWSDGYTQSQQSTGNFTFVQRTSLNLGVYCVTVTNAYGCSESICRNVSSSVQPMQVTGEIQQPICASLSGGAITLSVTGGVSPYTYLWSDGAQTKDRANLSPSHYCVTVTDINGCTETECFGVTTAVSNVKITIADLTMPEVCTESPTCQGAINIEASGGTAPYTYSWSGPNGFASNQQDISNLCTTGNYSVTVTDAQGCTSQKTIKICCCGNYGEPGMPPLPGECNFGIGAGINLNGQATPAFGTQGGSINISFNEGTGGYSLIWKKDGQFFSYNKNISNLQPGQYCVTVKKGCYEQSKCFNIVNCANTTISVSSSTNPTCDGYEAGKITIAIGGNGAAPYKYKWSNGSINQNLEYLTAGTYTVTVTDNNGCTGTSSFTINTVDIDFVDGFCIRYTVCGSEIIKVQEFDLYWQYDPFNCRYARLVCENYVGPYVDLGLTLEYPTGNPTDCVIRLRCTNGQIYDQYTGQTLTELVGGIDNCGLPYCVYVSYCYYPELNAYDENSVQPISNGNITNIIGAFLGQSCNNPGCYPPVSPCCKNKYYCEGDYIGEGYGPCTAAPSPFNDTVPDIESLNRAIQQQHPEYKTLSEGIKGTTKHDQQVADRYELVKRDSERKMFNVSPNPFFDRFTVKLFSDKEKEVSFALMDVNGKVLAQKAFNVLKGGNELVFNIENHCPAGSYFLIMTDEAGNTDSCLMIKTN